MTHTRGRTVVRLLFVLVSFTLVAAACGSDNTDDGAAATDTSGSAETPETPETPDAPDTPDSTDGSETPDVPDAPDPDPDVPRTASFRGVTEDTITVGITMLDFAQLTDLGLIKSGWGDQVAVNKALIADLNERGGINGRTVVANYEFYSPISATAADEVCTKLTQDIESFAIIGGFLGPLGGTADPCITGLNETILIGGEMNADELAQSVAPWYHVSPSVEDQTVNLLDLLAANGYIESSNVFVMGGVAAEAQFDFVVAELASRDFNVVGEAIIVAADGDTGDQDNELGPVLERVKESGADTIFIFGNPSAIIRGIADAGLNGEIAVWSNNNAGLNNLGATIPDKSVANGTISSGGPTDTEIWNDPLYQSACSQPVADRVPEADIKPPAEYQEGEENWFNAIRLACQNLFLFEQIATAAGVDLTQDSFVAGANTLTDFAMPASPESSLGPDKITSRDLERLTIYDNTEGDGGTVPLTDLVNMTG
jgi:hypothetical protein